MVKADGAPEGCPEKYEACVYRADLRTLLRHLDDMRMYSAEAWARCGPGKETR